MAVGRCAAWPVENIIDWSSKLTYAYQVWHTMDSMNFRIIHDHFKNNNHSDDVSIQTSNNIISLTGQRYSLMATQGSGDVILVDSC